MRAVLVGEGMLELSQEGAAWRLGYGGDTLNTAIHMARAGIETAYLTTLGSDPFSADLRVKWQNEGLDTSLLLTHPTRGCGLYAISTDERGERSFTYWRSESAAREMFALDAAHAAMAQASSAELLGFSLISLAILPQDGRRSLLELASRVRANGGTVAFDGNYRPRLWASTQEAIDVRDAAIEVAQIGLPTLEDEAELAGLSSADQVAAHWQGLGCAETVVKLGAEGCRMPDGTIIAPERELAPVDTSGAGDAFNGGYLAARMEGDLPAAAARKGHETAGWTIMHRGAIPPRD